MDGVILVVMRDNYPASVNSCDFIMLGVYQYVLVSFNTGVFMMFIYNFRSP